MWLIILIVAFRILILPLSNMLNFVPKMYLHETIITYEKHK